jgi:outer membrane protein TolC
MHSSRVRSLRKTLRARVPLALLGLTVVAGLTRPAHARRYTLPELIDKVSAGYAGVQAARDNVTSARAQLSQANGLLWPQGALTFGLTTTPNVQCADGNGVVGADQVKRELNCVSTNNVDLLHSNIEQVLPYHGVGVSLNLSFVQPIYTFGKIAAARHAAEAGIDVALAQVDKDRADVILNVTRAYWGLKWSRAAWATLDDGRQKLREWVNKIDAALDQPKPSYTPADLSRMKLALDTSEYSLLDIEKARELALAGLRLLTSDPDADIDDEELDVVELAEQPLSFYEDAAMVSRPESRMLSAGLRAVHAQRAYGWANLFPDIGLATTFNVSYASSIDNPQSAFLNHPDSLGFSLSLALRYNLDIAGRVATWRKAKADERVLEARRRQALGGITLEIENAWLETSVARKKSDLLSHSEKVARGWYNSVDQALTVGTGNARDLVEAARNYFELRLRHLQSIMDVNMAVTQLKMATGALTR